MKKITRTIKLSVALLIGFTLKSMAQDAIVDGGFESNSFANWPTIGVNPSPSISSSTSHSGTYCLALGSLGGEIPGDASVYQTISVPTAGGTLSYWYQPYTTDGLAFDWQDAYITDLSGTILATIMHNCTISGWTNITYNMSAFAGQTVRLEFLVHGDNSGDPTYMYIDDVSLPVTVNTTVTSFTPAEGCANTASVVITGTDFYNVSDVLFGGTSALSFTVNSTTQITANVGSGTSGVITVVTPNSGTSAATFTVDALPVISAATATSSTICMGDVSNLNATSMGNSINWWDAASGGNLLNTVPSGVNYAVNPTSTTTYYAEAISPASGSAEPGGYCSPIMYPSNGCNYLNSVSTSGGITNFTNITGAYNGSGYTYFPSYIVSQTLGGSFTLYCQTQGTCGIAYYNIWVDWNRDGDFNDAGEAVVIANGANSGNSLVNFSINIPIGASIGNTRMRVLADGNAANPVTACDNLSGYYSEVEEYILDIQGSTGGCASASRTPVTITVNSLPTVSGNASATTICANNAETLTGAGATSYTWNNGVTDGVIFYPSTTTTYIVTGTDGNGCSSTASVLVNVNPLPTVSAFASSYGICLGNSVTLGGNGASSYTWDNSVTDGVSFYPASTATYNVTGIDGNGCANTASIQIDVYPLPTLSASAASAAICIGDATDLTATSVGNTINWWDAASGGTLLTTVASGTNYNVSPSTTTTYYAEAVTPSGGGASPSGYCSPTLFATNGCNYLYSVATSGGITNFNNITGAYNGSGFTVFPSNLVSQVVGGSFTITCQTQGTCGIVYYNIWIDWNRDGDFADAGEAVIVANGLNSGNNVTSFTINVPVGASSGNTHIRVLADGNATNPATACDDLSGYYSEVEEYILDIQGAVGGCTSVSRTPITVTVNSLPLVAANATSTNICSGANETLTGTGALTYTWDNGVTDGVIFYPTSTTTYNVTGTDGNGCMNTSSILVNVNSLPSVSANASSTTICAGDAETLTGSGALSYVWDNSVMDGVTFNPTTTNTYNVTGTDGNGCENSASVLVNVNPLPTVTYTETTILSCVYWAPFALAPGNPTGGIYSGTGVTGNNFDPFVAGAGSSTVTYSYTDGNGCVGNASSTLTVDVCTGVNSLVSSSTIAVYPNPSNGVFNITINQSTQVTIYNSLGELVLNQEMNASTTEIDMSRFSNGIYTLNAVTSNHQQTIRLIKN
ncbi:MAG: GEVED domain-containing protein [Bacteroidota bacterium]